MKRASSGLAQRGIWMLLALAVGCGQTTYQYRAYEDAAISAETKVPRDEFRSARSGHLLVTGSGRVLEVFSEDPGLEVLPLGGAFERFLIEVPDLPAGQRPRTLVNPRAFYQRWTHRGQFKEQSLLHGRVVLRSSSEQEIKADLDLEFGTNTFKRRSGRFAIQPPPPELLWEGAGLDKLIEQVDQGIREKRAQQP